MPGTFVRIAVGRPVEGWIEYDDTRAFPDQGFEPEGVSRAGDPLLLYFTSGTTALPKLVEHSQISYPIGHLSTMYWIGLRPGDVHLNISSPGWAKHAWSCVFAPWLAQATVLVFNYTRFDAAELMRVLDEQQVTTFCAPPTVWRMLIQADLTRLRTPPREVVGAGEPLNPEVIEQVRRAWRVTIRDGFGQTEMTLAVGNSPGIPVRPGSMGLPMPGYRVALLDPASGEPGDEGEICFDLSAGTVGLLTGYHGEPKRTAEATRGGYYHTGDLGSRDADGYLTYVGRDDDVFKASDYRISPFAVESVLLEHPAVAEAAVVPSPDPLRLAVPKAYVVLAEGYHPNQVAARLIFEHSRDQTGALPTDPPPGIRPTAQDHLRQDPPGGSARAGTGTARRECRRWVGRGVRGGGLPRAALTGCARCECAWVSWSGAGGQAGRRTRQGQADEEDPSSVTIGRVGLLIKVPAKAPDGPHRHAAGGRGGQGAARGEGAVDVGHVPAGVHLRSCPAVGCGRGRVPDRVGRLVPLLTGHDDHRDAVTWLDVDDTMRETHGYAKQGVGYGYNKVKGLNALLGIVSTAVSAPIIVGHRLRRAR